MGEEQICCVQAPPMGAHVPQLALQQNVPLGQTLPPQVGG
jgi:hypothetical protein